jgi:hypothetical protein
MDKNIKPVIVVLAYNRPKSLVRLLESISKADYPVKAKLIISLEGGATNEVIRISNQFHLNNLDKSIIKRSEKLGLRKHILICGDLVKEYGAVIILEDDLIVDKYYYRFACDSLKFYKDDTSIAGIALYSHEYNQFSNLPFRPMINGYATYPMQLPCSWGQCWTDKQWFTFKDWYEGKTNSDLDKIIGLPDQVKAWPDSSWKKFFHGYIVEEKLYFMYPYESYSTNCSDEGGTHITEGSNAHQVKMATALRPYFSMNFCPSLNNEVSYDAFMEPDGNFVFSSLGIDRENITIDVQGIKSMNLLLKKDFVITSKPADNILKYYNLKFKPIEFNFLSVSEEKSDIFLVKVNDLKSEKPKHSYNFYAYWTEMNLLNLTYLLAFLRKAVSKAIHKFSFATD